MRRKKVIGIPGYKTPQGEFFGAGIHNLTFLEKFGNVRVLSPWEKKVDIDLLYLPGGLDLSPSSYRRAPSFATSNHDVMKEWFFKNRLKYYVGKTPIFGVCLGSQMLGVYFGSIMTQDLSFHPQSPGRWETAHEVTLAQDWVGLKEGHSFEVNSHHHQCIMESELGNDLSVLARTEHEEFGLDPTDSIVEAFKHNTLPIVGVQWHPEELHDEFSVETIISLLYGEDKNEQTSTKA